jgi:signal transduction histidine kinase
MNPVLPETEIELRQQRELVRQAMLRANTAVAVILAALAGLALAAFVAGVRAVRNQHRAESSERDQQSQLLQSYLAQARAMRLSGIVGARAQALTAIANAAAIHPSAELRNEAIACLNLMDLEMRAAPRGQVEGDLRFFDVAPSLDTFARVFKTGWSELVRFEGAESVVVLDPELAGLDASAIATWARFSPDGLHFGVGFLDGTVLLWQVADRRLVLQHLRPGHGRLTVPVFSPDGRWFAHRNSHLPEGDGLSLFEPATGRTVDLPGVMPYHAVAVAPDKPWVALGTGHTVRVIDFETGNTLHTLAHPAAVTRLEWSHDGSRLAAGCEQGDVLLWDVEPNRFQVLSGHTEFVSTLEFSPDDRLLLSAGMEETSRLWDCQQGRQMLWVPELEALRFGPDGSEVAFLQKGTGTGIWRLVRPTVVTTFPIRGSANDPNQPFDLSPGGGRLAALAPGGVHLWDLEAPGPGWFEPFPAETNAPRMRSWSVTFHPDEDALLVCYLGRLEFWEIETDATGRPRGFGTKRTVPTPDGEPPRQATLSLDGRTLLVETTNRRFVILDALNERPPVRLDGEGLLYYWSQAGSPTGAGRFVLSPDGRWAAVSKDVGPQPGPTLWDTRTGEILISLDVAGFAAFSPDGEWFGASSANRFVGFRTRDWQVALEQDRPSLAGRAGMFAWPQDSRWLLVAHSRQTVELQDARTGASLALFSVPANESAAGARLSHDGRRMVVSTPRNLLVSCDLAALRRELRGWDLDWPDPDPNDPTSPMLATLPRSGGGLGPAHLGAIGLILVTAAAGFAGVMLRRHRALTLQFVRSESLARQRRRELETAREELLHSQKMKALGTLAAGIAHDFNNLLSIIRMSNRLIGRSTPTHPDVQEHVDDIEQAVQQGKTVVQSMLGYARETVDDSVAQDLDAVVEETVSLLSREFLSGIQLTLELDRFLPPVAVGRGRLEQVLLNIVVNAAEAMKARGKLRIITRECIVPTDESLVLRPRTASGYIELTVADSGPGMEPDVIERIFEPFFTTKKDATRQGTGLGLSMVYAIAEQDGLGLAVVSAPGKGATFTVLVPVATAPASVRQTHIGELPTSD